MHPSLRPGLPRAGGSRAAQRLRSAAFGLLQHTRAALRLPTIPTALVSIPRTLVIAAALLATSPIARAQYPGHIDTSKPAKGSTLRAVAVLEWTGPPGKPSASRLIPITIFDGDHLHDGTLYLSQPAPLALQSGNEYELQSAGTPIGLYDLHSAGHSQLGDLDSWLGYGVWKPLPKPAPPALNTSGLTVTGLNEDEPVLLRKHPKGSDQAGAQTRAKSGTATSGGSGPVDPDRPTLRRSSSGSESSAPTAGTQQTGTQQAGTQQPGGAGPVDPDRPTLHHLPPASTTPATGDGSLRETGLNSPDPNRPRLTYGKPKDLASAALELKGAPPHLQQMVAVSDPTASMPHPWSYSWPSPFDQANARRALESIARSALAAQPAAAPPSLTPSTSTKSSSRHSAARAGTPLTPPARLGQESFRSFELEYGAAPTMVFSASTPPPDSTSPAAPMLDASGQPVSAPPQRFVTLIAQLDLYGNPIVLKKIVTDAAHLDEIPRMHLIDAVDALGNHRAELLFERIGGHQRSFALYSVIDGSIQRIFVTVSLP